MELFKKRKGVSFRLAVNFNGQLNEEFFFSVLETLFSRVSVENTLNKVLDVEPISSFTTPIERREETSLSGRDIAFGRDGEYAAMSMDLICYKTMGPVDTTKYEGRVTFAENQAFRGQKVLHVPLGKTASVGRF